MYGICYVLKPVLLIFVCFIYWRNLMNYQRQEKSGMYDPLYERDSCGIGFVANIKGKKSYLIIKKGLEVIERMTHRGAEGSDNKTGDGSGIMLQVPHSYYSEIIAGLPEAGEYGTGIVFLPVSSSDRATCISELERIIAA